MQYVTMYSTEMLCYAEILVGLEIAPTLVLKWKLSVLCGNQFEGFFFFYCISMLEQKQRFGYFCRESLCDVQHLYDRQAKVTQSTPRS